MRRITHRNTPSRPGALLGALLGACVLALVAPSPVPADDHGGAPGATGGEAPQMSPEEQQMMERWMAVGTPGPEHAQIATMAGSWAGTMKMRMAAHAPWMETPFTYEAKMILGGRYLEGTYRCDMGGMPFEGRSLLGYNRVEGEYNSLWMDNMSTFAIVMTGTYDEATKQFTEEGEMYDIKTESWLALRGVTTIHGTDHYTYEQYLEGEDGEYYLSMSIDYRRVGT